MVWIILATAALVLCAVNSAADARPPLVIAYYAEWAAAGGLTVDRIPADRLTHLNYAFAQIVDGQIALIDATAATGPAAAADAGGDALQGNFGGLARLKQRHPHLRTLISVGGWTKSGPFSDAAMTEASRKRFAESCATFVGRYGFDGVDIDWEYPAVDGFEKGKSRPEDTRNFTLLLQAIRDALDAATLPGGQRYLLTIATGAPESIHAKIELPAVAGIVDWINVMTYDMAGTWNPRTTFNAPLHPADRSQPGALSVATAIDGYLAARVPAEKLVLGVPFYGRAFGGVGPETGGFGQPLDPKQTPRDSGGAYRRILTQLATGQLQEHWHEQAKVPWLYDPQAKVFVTFDDPRSIELKARFARDRGLAGVMFWELSEDGEDFPLLRAVREGLQIGNSADSP